MGEPRLRGASKPPARGSGRSSSLLLQLHHSFLAPAIRHRRASLLQIDRCTTTLHKAAINRKRSAAQYVYNTKAK